MHELSLAQSVVEIICEEAQRHELARIDGFRLEVGELRAVVPELLYICLGFTTKGTPAEGAAVQIDEVPGRARCPTCGLEFSIHELLFLCPACEHVGGEILAGEELRVVELEGE